MRIKRFEAKDSTTALAMIKEEMGEDAVILSTKKLPTSRSQHDKVHAKIEVVAAIDYDTDEISLNPPNEANPKESPTRPNFETYGRTGLPPKKQAAVATSPQSELHSEARDLRLRFANIFQHPGKKNKQPTIVPASSARREKALSKPNPAKVAIWRDKVIDGIRVQEPLPLINFSGPNIIALVGATGVGKTTTAAKIAAWYSLHHGKKVCLLSMDCYRIGATDQLRAYAKIMRLPCEIVLRKNQLAQAVNRHQDSDLILIDTAGKSPYDHSHIHELQEWFAQIPDIVPHLVLSATTKKEDIINLLQTYSPLSASSIILSKLDETRAYAALCQQIVSSRLPISYLSTGQKVPEDFFVASKEMLDRLFKQGWNATFSPESSCSQSYS